MSSEIKIKILLFFCLLCLAGLLTQAYLLYELNTDRAISDLEDRSIPESIMEKLEQQIARPDRLFDGEGSSLSNNSVTSDPFSTMRAMQTQMDQLFNSMLGSSFPAYGSPWSVTMTDLPSQPQILVEDQKDAFLVTLSKHPEQNIEISTELEDNVLTMTGVVESRRSQTQGGSRFSSSSYSQFSRSIEFPHEVNALGMTSSQEDERITILVPKLQS
jgi:HSP20 family molecular chaperone IbpA